MVTEKTSPLQTSVLTNCATMIQTCICGDKPSAFILSGISCLAGQLSAVQGGHCEWSWLLKFLNKFTDRNQK